MTGEVFISLPDAQPDGDRRGFDCSLSNPADDGEAHTHLLLEDGQAFRLTVKWSHLCLNIMRNHTVCYPRVTACTHTITLQVHTHYEYFKHSCKLTLRMLQDSIGVWWISEIVVGKSIVLWCNVFNLCSFFVCLFFSKTMFQHHFILQLFMPPHYNVNKHTTIYSLCFNVII